MDDLEIRRQLIADYERDWTSCYPPTCDRTLTLEEYRAKYTDLEDGVIDQSQTESLVGRIKTKREASKKLIFYTFESEGETMQLLVNFKLYENPEHFKVINRLLHPGDFVGATGYPGKSKKGELSLVPQSLTMLAPCLRMIPREQFALKNEETRVQKRYLDLLTNRKSRDTFLIRAKVISSIRRYLDDAGFLEVQTPVLASRAGGATARPFTTHHHELKADLFMRIAPELYLKTLVVGGYDRVYEIGPQFRNEGIDPTHNPEFWTVEFYEAYADYHRLMARTEELLPAMVERICGSLKVEYQPLHGEPITLDFTPPYRRVSIVPELEKKTGVEFPKLDDSPETVDFLLRLAKKLAIVCPPPLTAARLIDRLVGELIEPDCQNPTFIIDHPRVMSPLAKWHRSDDSLSERFELFVAGFEVANAYTELNHPGVQQAEFLKQAEAKKLGDVEAQDLDADYIETLEHGLPPTAGFGAGIDRLTMLLSNQNSIRNVLLFPAQKPKPPTPDGGPEKTGEKADQAL